MNYIRFEINKILKRRFTLILLVFTTIAFPVLIKIITHLNVVKDGVPEGMFAANVAFGIISFSHLYLFLPIWIIVVIGQELSDGHVNRVVFEKSKKFYFRLKLVYCGIVTAFFSVIGLIAFVIALNTSPFAGFSVEFTFYIKFFIQYIISTFSLSVLLLCFVFFLRSPIVSFVVYLIWGFLEAILYNAINGIYKIELTWLPFHLIQGLYVKNGVVASANYFNPLDGNLSTILLLPFIFLSILLILTFYHFKKTDLKPLSD